MRTSGRGLRNSYVQTVLGTTGLNNYWGFDAGIPFTRFGSISLTSTNSPTYTTKGKIGRVAATFDGVNQALYSSAAIDLTATNKVSLVFWWKPIVFDLVNNELIFEFSASVSTNVGAFQIRTSGLTAGDPISIFCNGDVGLNEKSYSKTLYGWENNVFYHMTAVYDFSVAASAELSLYVNGVLISSDGGVSISNNTGNFGNYVLYLASRANASAFANCMLDEVALFNTALTQAQITAIYQSSFY